MSSHDSFEVTAKQSCSYIQTAILLKSDESHLYKYANEPEENKIRLKETRRGNSIGSVTCEAFITAFRVKS